MNKPATFSDDHPLDPNSPPDVDYNPDPIIAAIPAASAQTTTTTVVTKEPPKPTPVIGPSCELHAPPWPTIIISVLGAIVVIYTAVAPGVVNDRRIFGIILMILWTIVWALILWVLWKECHRAASWWLLLIPVIIMAIFFILIIVMNIGAI